MTKLAVTFCAKFIRDVLRKLVHSMCQSICHGMQSMLQTSVSANRDSVAVLLIQDIWNADLTAQPQV